MDELDKIIKEFNLIFTGTLTREDTYRKGYDNTNVDYEDCVSLYEILKTFIETHRQFRKEYDELPKLDLGGFVDIGFSYDYEVDGMNCRSLEIYIDEPSIIEKPFTYLTIREEDGKMCSFVTNKENPLSKKYYYKEVTLDEELSKKYLDFFQKYAPLIKFYNYYRTLFDYGDGTYMIMHSLYIHDDTILKDMYGFDYFISASYFNTSYTFNIAINLENDTIDKEKSYIELEDKRIPVNEEIYEKILKEIYLNKERLRYPTYYDGDRDLFERLEELKNSLDEKGKNKR